MSFKTEIYCSYATEMIFKTILSFYLLDILIFKSNVIGFLAKLQLFIKSTDEKSNKSISQNCSAIKLALNLIKIENKRKMIFN